MAHFGTEAVGAVEQIRRILGPFLSSHQIRPRPAALGIARVGQNSVQLGDGSIYAGGVVRRVRDGSTWRIGTDAEVAWIANGTSVGRTITAAIPPVFESLRHGRAAAQG